LLHSTDLPWDYAKGAEHATIQIQYLFQIIRKIHKKYPFTAVQQMVVLYETTIFYCFFLKKFRTFI
jgi:hypothetical protein